MRLDRTPSPLTYKAKEFLQDELFQDDKGNECNFNGRIEYEYNIDEREATILLCMVVLRRYDRKPVEMTDDSLKLSVTELIRNILNLKTDDRIVFNCEIVRV